jgi:hypothetical protein
MSRKPYPKWNVIRLWATGCPLFVCKVPQLDYAPKDVSLCVFGELQYAISIQIYIFCGPREYTNFGQACQLACILLVEQISVLENLEPYL